MKKKIYFNLDNFDFIYGEHDASKYIKKILKNKYQILKYNSSVKNQKVIIFDEFVNHSTLEFVEQINKNNNKVILVLTEYLTNIKFFNIKSYLYNYFYQRRLWFLLSLLPKLVLKIIFKLFPQIFLYSIPIIFYIFFNFVNPNSTYHNFFILFLIFIMIKEFKIGNTFKRFYEKLDEIYEMVLNVKYFKYRYKTSFQAMNISDLVIFPDKSVQNSFSSHVDYSLIKKKSICINLLENLNCERIKSNTTSIKNIKISIIGEKTELRTYLFRKILVFMTKKNLISEKYKQYLLDSFTGIFTTNTSQNKIAFILPKRPLNNHLSSSLFVRHINNKNIPIIFNLTSTFNHPFKNLKTCKRLTDIVKIFNNYSGYKKEIYRACIKERRSAIKNNMLAFKVIDEI